MNFGDPLEGVSHRFLVSVPRKECREDVTLRSATINGLPSLIMDGPDDGVRD